MTSFSISGHIVDVIKRKIYSGTVHVESGIIKSITPESSVPARYILPGFIDAHVHVESSMLVPSEFARLAVVHGTVATVSDPHEIGNVLGVEGVQYMIRNGQQVPFHFYFGAPSCVPATAFETAGATIDAAQIEALFKVDHLHYLSEMMNFPGVLIQNPVVMEKIAVAKREGKPIDGHAPGMRGKEIERYVAAGISTDHECFTLMEALDKVRYGMKILIREGSAAKNYEALHPLIQSHPDKVMFCSDDKHPHELVEGHINLLVRRSVIEKKYDLMDVLRCACYHPIMHYQLDVGCLQVGDSADFIVVNNLEEFNTTATYIRGQLVAKDGKTLIQSVSAPIINHFNCHPKQVQDFSLPERPGRLKVIEAIEGQLITRQLIMEPKIVKGYFESDPTRDMLKLAVINRYQEAPVALGFIHGFGLKEGAIASCVAHDSHNIIAVGTNDEDLCQAVNSLIHNKGGIAVAAGGKVELLPLPVGGIMSNEDGYEVAKRYVAIDAQAKRLGAVLQAPFMTLSFMALLVIPSLKLSDRGLFDGERFAFTDLMV